MNKYKNAREFCFQYFFHLQLPVFEDLKTNYQEENSVELKNSIAQFKESTNTILADDMNSFVEGYIVGTLKSYSELEERISKHLKNWKINRLSKVDHTNLLLSTYALCYEKDTPVTIIINEAIELSKKFGTKESSSFINGVLDSIAKDENK